MTPAIIVALVALLLQGGAVSLARRTSSAAAFVPPKGSILSYALESPLAIPALEASFVSRLLGGRIPNLATMVIVSQPADARPAPGGAPAPKRAPRTAPTPAPTAAPGIRLNPQAAKIHPSFTVDKTSAAGRDFVVYTVLARNDGDADVTATFLVNVHTPQFTVACTDLRPSVDQTVCSTPGDYDGASQDPNDNHLNPPSSTRAMTVPAHKEVVLRTLTVQVAPAAPPGTVLHNHAHVDVVGTGDGYGTFPAPDVSVKDPSVT